MPEKLIVASSRDLDDLISVLKLTRDADGALLINPHRVKVFEKNPRKKFRRIPGLAQSIESVGKQLQPGIVRLRQGDLEFDAELVDGERRIRAMRMLYDKDPRWMFRAFPNTSIRDARAHFKESFIANFCREEHDCIEIANGIKDLMDGGETMATIAEMAGGKSITWVSQHLSLLKLDPEVQAMIVPDEKDEGKKRLSFGVALRLTSYPPQEQIDVAKQIEKEGMSQVKARRHIAQIGRRLKTEGVAIRKRKHKAIDALMKFTENIGDHMGIYLDMTEDETDEMLLSVPEPTKDLLLRRLKIMGEGINRLGQQVKKRCKSVA